MLPLPKAAFHRILIPRWHLPWKEVTSIHRLRSFRSTGHPGWNSVQAVNKYLDEPNGKIKGGDAGIRLIEPAANAKTTYFKANIQPVELNDGEFLIVPVYQIFGSDEMSSAASTLSQQIPEPFVFLNPNDAEVLKLEADELVQLKIENTILNIKVRTEASIGRRMAGLSVNFARNAVCGIARDRRVCKKGNNIKFYE